jgi:hypothetical protein
MSTEIVTSPPITAALRADPFTGLNFHFGMLLGVEDFETQQSYVRGQSRIASAWQHGAGVVWGFGVNYVAESGELRVEPGLAFDGAGHTLHLDTAACISVGRWAAKHSEEFDLPDPVPQEVTIDASVRVRFRACLTRQVPAITTLCDGTSTGTAYSRVVETVELTLEPWLESTWPDPMPFHRLRLLFGIDAPHKDDDGVVTDDDQAVLDERAVIASLALGDQPAAKLAALRRFAALDSVGRRPALIDEELLRYPEPEDEGVIIAHLKGLRLRRPTPGDPPDSPWEVIEAPVSVDARQTLVDTATIQELLTGRLGQTDAGGPRAIAERVTIEDQTITVPLDKSLDEVSVSAAAVSVTAFDANGWADVDVLDVDFENATNNFVMLLNEPPGDRLIRIIVRGTGPTPLLGTDAAPFAGPVGGPPAAGYDGADFAYHIDRRQ